MPEVIALEQQGRIERLGCRTGEAAAKVEAGPVAAAAPSSGMAAMKRVQGELISPFNWRDMTASIRQRTK
jgi:hypothetical protein